MKTLNSAILIVIMAQFVPLASVTAQTLPVKVGDRVRVTVPDVGRREGTVWVLTTDSLVLRVSGEIYRSRSRSVRTSPNTAHG